MCPLLQVLRENKAALMTCAETFLHDPLVEWTKHHRGAAEELENPMVRLTHTHRLDELTCKASTKVQACISWLSISCQQMSALEVPVWEA
jgi:phosphatidylinositol kinase/protein kinase (PI-3  family)